MSEHLTNKQIEGYGHRTLRAAELLSASDHLGGCESCRRQVEKSLDGDAAFFALKSEVFGGTETLSSPARRAHLTSEQTSQYIDGAIAGDELQAVKDHLSACEQCVMAVNDLLDFKNIVSTELNREFRPSPARVATESRWHRFVANMSSRLPRPTALAFGSALAMLLLLLAGWLILQALQRNEKKPEITKTAPSPTTEPSTPVVSPSPSPGGAAEILLAQLNDGEGRVALDREGKLSGVDYLPPAYQRMVMGALTNQQIEKSPLLAGLTRPESSNVRGSGSPGNQFSLIKPVGKVLLSDRPVFQWSPLEGATGYIVEVYDEKFNLSASSSQLTNNFWTAAQALKRGEIYSWQVKAIKDGQEFVSPRPPAPEAKFRILDQATTAEITRARRDYASSHLLLGLLYARAGLIAEAEQEFRALEKANPDSPNLEVARRLLASVSAPHR